MTSATLPSLESTVSMVASVDDREKGSWLIVGPIRRINGPVDHGVAESIVRRSLAGATRVIGRRTTMRHLIGDLLWLLPALSVSSLATALVLVAHTLDSVSLNVLAALLAYLASAALLGPLGVIIFAIPAGVFAYLRRRPPFYLGRTRSRWSTALKSCLVIGTLTVLPAGVLGGASVPTEVFVYTVGYSYGVGFVFGLLLPPWKPEAP